MKKNIRFLKPIIIVILFLSAFQVEAQGYSEDLRIFISDPQNLSDAGTKNSLLLKRFYEFSGFKYAWLGKENTKNLDDLVTLISHSTISGLEKTDYPLSYSHLQDSSLMNNRRDSFRTELHYTEIALQFTKDLIFGNTQPALGYNGLTYSPDINAIPGLLASYISAHNLSSLTTQEEKSLPEIASFKKKLEWMQRIISDSNFMEVSIGSAPVIRKNNALLTKLYQLGILDSINERIPDSVVIEKVKEAQRQFNLLDDGILRPTALEEFNVPLRLRVQQLNLSVNYYRWLYGLTRNQSVVVVNIPAAALKVYHNNDVILEMRMVVGKRSTPTPTLASRINEVVLYPYWNVPFSIATKELLPSIKKNPGFIAAGDFQVLNKSGKIVDPYTINWEQINSKNFPYVIRQSTGCDNALGLLKLNFYSPYGVYLHDTPLKSLFMLNKRYFSHGCMRMEEPFKLGHLILKNNAIAIDTLTEKGCLRNQSPITVSADEQMPVLVWYNPAGIDSTGRVIFYEDVYKKFPWSKKNGNKK